MTSGECEADFVMSTQGERAMGDSEVEMMLLRTDDELKECMTWKAVWPFFWTELIFPVWSFFAGQWPYLGVCNPYFSTKRRK